ncbi:MAG: two-component regulator propeller domain-containing protein [Bacteroidota bacterium]
MNTRKTTLTAWLLILFIIDSGGYNFKFRNYQVNNGLSENTVQAILQDKTGFIWMGTKDGLNRFDGNEFRVFRHDPRQVQSIGNSFVRSILEDRNGKLWVGTDKNLYLFDPLTEEFSLFDKKTPEGTAISSEVHSLCAENEDIIWIGTGTQGAFCYFQDKDSLVQISSGSSDTRLPSNLVWRIFRDYSGSVWLGTRGGLSRFIRETGSYQTYEPHSENTPGNNEILSIYEDSDGDLWLGTWSGGLFRMDKTTNQFKSFFQSGDSLHITKIRSLLEYEKNALFIGSDDGLFIFNKITGDCTRIDEPGNIYSLGDQNVYAICRDREGGVWVGTYFGGVGYLSPATKAFRHYYPGNSEETLSGKAVSQFCEDEKENLWIATEDGGLNYFNVKTGKFKKFTPQKTGKGLSYHNVHSLVIHNNHLWIGTFSQGIDVLNLETNTWRNYQYENDDNNSLDDNCVFALYVNKAGELYAGTPFGLSRYDPVNDNFIRIREVRGFVYDMLEDGFGNFWVTTYGRGLFRYEPVAGTWKNYVHEEGNEKSLNFNKVIDVYLDDMQRLWFGTEGNGLSRYNYETDDFTSIDGRSGLPNNVVYGILDDKFGNLWVSTNMGITRINPLTLEMKTFTIEDGLQSNQFNYKSSHKSGNGFLYFGGINGFNVFHPDHLITNSYIPPVVITGIVLLDDLERPGKRSDLIQEIHLNKKLTLKYNQASFRIGFVSISYQAVEKNQYACILEGLENRWRPVGNEKSLTYINLPPGDYTFRVKGSNNDGIWNESGDYLQIKILKPVWRSTAALLIYSVILLVGLYFAIQSIINRTRERQHKKLENFRIEKEKEMYESKIVLFTHLAHEIRNPVTLIKAPLETVMNSGDFHPDVKENLSVIERNTDKLLELVNQLLDFRKVEESKFRLRISATDANEFLHELYFRFKSTASNQHVDLSLCLPEEKIVANFDRDAINKVLGNLITNAIKFSKSKVEICLALDSKSDMIEFRVSDDGQGIEKKYREKVFEPFFQLINGEVKHLKSGTGIGLTISKQLVELHNGKVFIEDGNPDGCQFVVRIPSNLEISDMDFVERDTPLQDVIHPIPDSPMAGNDKMHILIVEDNEELRIFLEKNLKMDYKVLLAGNGNEALHILEYNSIDLIISDIAMPGMDGLELAGLLKQDDQFCHIPVILLSAKTNLQSKINGLVHGADIYIEKPFSVVYLKAQIASLIENRIRILEKFSRSPFIPYGSIASNKRDELFLEKLNELIEKNISDFNFSIDKLAFEMMMSRSNLQRKIKGVSGLVPNDYVRVYRLKKAARLILHGDYRINEICYLVGFNSGSYFSKCFLKQFGVLPKDFVKFSEVEE